MKAYGVVRRHPDQLKTTTFTIKTDPKLSVESISPNQLKVARKQIGPHQLSIIKQAQSKEKLSSIYPSRHSIFKNNDHSINRLSHPVQPSSKQQYDSTPVKLLNAPHEESHFQRQIHDRFGWEGSTPQKLERKRKIFNEDTIGKNQRSEKELVDDPQNELIRNNPEKQLMINRSLRAESQKRNSLRKTRIFEQFSPLKRTDAILEKDSTNKVGYRQSKPQQQNEIQIKTSKGGALPRKVTIFTIQNIEPFTF